MKKTIDEFLQMYGITQTDFAIKCKLSNAYISKIKNGRILPSNDAQEKIYNATGYYVTNVIFKYKNAYEQLMLEYQKIEYENNKLKGENNRLRHIIENINEVIINAKKSI